MSKFLHEFKEFAMRGNVLDMAVSVILEISLLLIFTISFDTSFSSSSLLFLYCVPYRFLVFQ